MSATYDVVMAPGCHSQPIAPVVSRHRSLRAAVRKAWRNDRLRVEPSTSSVCLYQARSAQPTPWGRGLYGGGDTRSLAAAYAAAEAAEREWRNGRG